MLYVMSEQESKDFFETHGGELVCITSWLSEPRFTVEELYLAFRERLVKELG